MKHVSFRRVVATIVTVILTICSFGIMQVSSSVTTESRTYIRRIYTKTGPTTQTTQEEYTLSLSPLTGINASQRDVFGPDDRVPSNDTSVVHFYGSNYNQWSTQTALGGTGFIIGAHTIATAAHCVYRKPEGNISSHVRITLKDPETGSEEVVYATEIHIPKMYTTVTERQHEYDYALLVVEEDLTKYGIFNLGELTDDATNKVPVSVTGYPSVVDGEKVSGQYTGAGYLYDVDEKTFRYKTDTSEGNSGGPVYVKSYYQVGDDEPVQLETVVGICTGRNNYDGNGYYNDACRITTPVLQFYHNNPNIAKS